MRNTSGKETAVPRLERIDPAEFQRRFVAPHRPLVITGAMAEWPAMERWSPEYFAEHLGDTKVQALTIPRKSADGEERWRSIRAVQLTMQEYVDELAAPQGPRHYVAGLPLRQFVPQLLADIEPPPYLEEGTPIAPRIWFGCGVQGPLHYDKTHNLHGIVSGGKRFHFVSPSQSSCLYPRSIFSGMPHMSQVSLRRPDPQRYPKQQRARPIEVEIGPGDLLFVPRGWWHEVSTPTATISIDFRWSGGPSLDWMLLRLLPSQLTSRLRRRRRAA